MNKAIAAFVAGLIFGIGLLIAQMTNPAKVIGFLDVTGQWDPSLVFVIAGGLATFSAAYWLSKSRPSPLLSPLFVVPQEKVITRPLVAGSVLFGIGWGLGGFCPGPAVVSAAFGDVRVWVFLLAVGAGIFLFRLSGSQEAQIPVSAAD
ncbi:MAG: DUF6691 family protein [Burkholderiales bacterium]